MRLLLLPDLARNARLWVVCAFVRAQEALHWEWSLLRQAVEQCLGGKDVGAGGTVHTVQETAQKVKGES